MNYISLSITFHLYTPLNMSDFSQAIQTKTNEELLKMVYGFDEWSPEMLSAVEAELSKRNLLPNDITLRRQQLIEVEEAELKEGRQAGFFGQIMGWLTVLGLLGIAIGYHYAFSKVASKYADKEYFRYNEASRRNGTYLFYTSICLSAMTILYRLIIADGVNV